MSSLVDGFYGPLAQLVEQLTLNQLVVGSIPTRPTIQGRSKTSKNVHSGEEIATGRLGSSRGILNGVTTNAPNAGSHTAMPAQFAERSPK